MLRAQPATLGAILYKSKGCGDDIPAAIVKEIFSLYAQDYTAAYIADEMRKRGIRTKKGKYLIRDIVLYNDKIIINYYFAEPLKKHTNSIASVIETEKQSREAASLSEIQSSYKGDNSPPVKTRSFRAGFTVCARWYSLPVADAIGATAQQSLFRRFAPYEPTASERKPACSAGFQWLFQNAIPHRPFTLLSASGR